jgi:PKHD-type hydroxylase
MIFTITEILQPAELAEIDSALASAKFDDGRSTASGEAARVKNNLQMDVKDPAYVQIGRIVRAALDRSEPFNRFALPLRTTPPRISRYEPGMTYCDHVDNQVMVGIPAVRADLALTIFLSDPQTYDGGELVIDSDFGAQKLKPPRGALVLYPASTLHRVQPVTRGVRMAVICWVQCMVRDYEKRRLLAELAQIRQWATEQAPDSRQVLQIMKIHAQLLRFWAEL